MKEYVNEFLSRLADEEKNFHSKLSQDRFGLAFLTAIKEFDFYYYNKIRNEPSEETDEHFYMLRLAVPRFIKKIYESIQQFEVPTATFRSSKTLILSALNMLSRFGIVEHGKRMAYAAMAGECELIKVEEDLYEFQLPAEMYNFEELEAEVVRFHNAQSRKEKNFFIEQEFISKGVYDHVEELLMDNVYVYRDHFIGYNAHPDLDDFFFGLAYIEMQYQPAYDTFHHKLKFGGLQYQHYFLCATYFLSLALKHEKFCEALIKKAPAIQLRNILTITCEKDDFIESIKEALNTYGPSFDWFVPINRQQAEALFNVLSVRRNNAQILEEGLMSPPYIVEFSDSAVVKSIAGAQIEPSEFLLESLRFNFPKEYDKHQQTREGAMQKALERLLSGSFPDLIIRKNIQIRENKKISTDIDFVVIEAVSKTAILFQLKHQDHYGGNIKKRSSRSKRLQTETERWLSIVNAWLNNNSRERINSAFQIKSSVEIEQFYTLAITKNFAHFLAPLAKDENFSYATWIQFYDAVARINISQGEIKTLRGLFNILREFMSHKIARSQILEGSDLYNLDTLKYKIIQKEQ